MEYINLDANGIQSILYDIYSMIHSCRKSNTLLILGVSGCIFLPFLRYFCNSKIIVNIDGLEWKREKWGPIAKVFLKLSESIAIRYSHIVISDNKVIFDYIKNRLEEKHRFKFEELNPKDLMEARNILSPKFAILKNAL